jgi:hypothetical protein
MHKTTNAGGLLIAALTTVLTATPAAAVTLWYGQVGASGGAAETTGVRELGFTLGGVAPGTAAGDQLDGAFGFWIVPGEGAVPVAATDPAVPPASALFQNYPNPVQTRTTLAYRIGATDKSAGAVPVRLDIYDVAGRRIATLVDDVRAPGEHRVDWDGRDQHGRAVASGVYLARFTTENFTQTVRMLRVR